MSVESVKSDFNRYNKKRKPAYQNINSKSPSAEIAVNRTERLTTAKMIYFTAFCTMLVLDTHLHKLLILRGLTLRSLLVGYSPRFLLKFTPTVLSKIHKWRTSLRRMMKDLSFKTFFIKNTLMKRIQIFLPSVNQCLLALHSRNSRHNEKKILDQLQNTINSPQNTEELRTQLKKIRNSRNSPPRIPNNLLDSHC